MRVDRLVKDYGATDTRYLLESASKLEKMGKKAIEEVQNMIRERKYEQACEKLLREYYDVRYSGPLKKKDFAETFDARQLTSTEEIANSLLYFKSQLHIKEKS